MRIERGGIFVRKGSYKKIGVICIPIGAAVLASIILVTGIFSRGALKVHADNIMKDVEPKKIEAVALKEDFIRSTADFSIRLFKEVYTKGENSLVSPTSVYLALGMTANGADGNTLKEFENLLGKYNLDIKELNKYYYSQAKKLTAVESGKVNIANSIWYSDDKSLDIQKSFLQANANYYNSSAYKADFASKQTVKDINNWVKNNTEGLIDKIVEDINDEAIMYLINTVYFEDKWLVPYESSSVSENKFNLQDGSSRTVEFMYSGEGVYLKDDKAQGFVKFYENGRYSFVTILPNEGISLDSYLTSLSGESFIKLMNSKIVGNVSTGLPKFKAGYSRKLVEPLKNMGLKDCFNTGKANFSKMGTSSRGNLYIGDILHKTFIAVDQEGTKAGAATKVEMLCGSAAPELSVILDRPFLYAIVDNETNLPLFVGTMVNPEY